MRNVEHQSTVGSDGILPRISILVVIGFLVGYAGATAMADDAAEESIPPEFTRKTMPTGTSDDPKAQVAGKEIYEGKINPAVNCTRCHGSDGKPTKLGKGRSGSVRSIGQQEAFGHTLVLAYLGKEIWDHDAGV